MWGVVTHVSDPKINTACTTALKNIPNTVGFTSSLLNILDNCAQLLLALRRFRTTSYKSSSEAVVI